MARLLPIVLVFLVGVLIIPGTHALGTNTHESLLDHQDMFLSFQRTYGKSYPNVAEEQLRFRIFQDNLDRIDRMNTEQWGGQGVTFEMNGFGDLSSEEFASTILMPRSKPDTLPIEKQARFPSAQDPLPTSWDWREHGSVVTPVKDQGSVGSCYAFSTTGNIEGQWALAGHFLVGLSEEQIVDCDNLDCGVFGGWPYRVMEYVIGVGGLKSEDQYPYCCGTGKCYPCSPPGYNETFCGPGPEYCNATAYPCRAKKGDQFAASIKDWKAISKDENDIANALVQTGPLSVCLDASLLQFYHSGVYDPIFCSSTDLDHAVLMVGYGTESGVFGKKDFWLIKNSWGEKWGEKGYFKILRGKGKCGINQLVVTSVV